MLKLNRIFAFLALFLGFYINGISINLNLSTKHSQEENFNTIFKQKKAADNNAPTPFIEPFDEKELDEDEQIGVNHSFSIQEKITHFLAVQILFEKQISLPYLFQQNFAF